MSKFILGVDGGGTKTDAVIADETERLLPQQLMVVPTGKEWALKKH